jgi:tetratricopeptide (TPR) repeat protein
MAATQALLASTPEEAESLALEAIRLSEANGYLAFASATRIMLGRARAALGRPAEGAAMMDESLHGAGQPPVRGSMTMYLTWLAEAHAMNHDLDLAQVAIEKALSINPRELFFRPETLRVRGDLLHGLGRIDLAVADYRAAVELARSMGAKVFVARALSSLAGLQQSGGSGRRQDTAE